LEIKNIGIEDIVPTSELVTVKVLGGIKVCITN
jgi:hypothetical protein